MKSKNGFSVSRFGWFSAILISFPSCEFSPPEEPSPTANGQAQPELQPQQEPPLQALCADSRSVTGKVILRAKRDLGSCDGLVLDQTFKITDITGRHIVLYGIPHVRYCVEIKRLSGYITIMHDYGAVRRHEDRFVWCTVPSTRDPNSMRVISFTPTAEFQLLLSP